jgi:endonuclease III
LIWHGRRICDARRPLCEECVVNDLCPSARVWTEHAAGGNIGAPPT